MTRDAPKRETGHTTADRLPSGRLKTYVLLGATSGGIYLCWLLAAPFLPALIWALVLAVLFTPVHRTIEARLKRPNVAALASVILVAAAIVAPATFVAQRLVTEAGNGADVVQAQLEAGAWRRLLEAHPQLAPFEEWFEQMIDLSAIIHNAATFFTKAAASFVRGSIIQFLGLLLTFYLLFFFLRDRDLVLTSLRRAMPLSQAELDRLFGRTVATIHATIYGTLVVASLQGALGGLMFWWLALPAPLLWGFVMALLSLVPVLGAFVVWIPAAFYLALEGDWAKAGILAFWGAVVVGHVDNILRPILVGNHLDLHPVLLFVSFLGGLSLFGGTGLVLGPLVVTTTLTLLAIWHDRTSEPLD